MCFALRHNFFPKTIFAATLNSRANDARSNDSDLRDKRSVNIFREITMKTAKQELTKFLYAGINQL